MKLTAELVAVEIIPESEEEKELVMALSCEGFDGEKVELKIGDKMYNLDGSDLMEAVARISSEWPTSKKSEDN